MHIPGTYQLTEFSSTLERLSHDNERIERQRHIRERLAAEAVGRYLATRQAFAAKYEVASY